MSPFVLAVTTSICRPMAEAAVCNSRDEGLGSKGIGGIDEHAEPRRCRQQLVREPEPLCPDLHAERHDPGGVAARPIEAGDQADLRPGQCQC